MIKGQVKTALGALSMVLIATPVWTCTALEPKNAVKTAEVCGRTQDPSGEAIADLGLRLVLKDNTVVAEVQTDAAGDFHFAPVAKGDYYMTTASKGWQLGWPVRVTSSKVFKSCSHPLIVQPALLCGGLISKRGYHAKF